MTTKFAGFAASTMYVAIAVVWVALAVLGLIPILSAVIASVGAAGYILGVGIPASRKHKRSLDAERKRELEKRTKQLERELEIGTENKLSAIDAFIQKTDRKLNPEKKLERQLINQYAVPSHIMGGRCDMVSDDVASGNTGVSQYIQSLDHLMDLAAIEKRWTQYENLRKRRERIISLDLAAARKEQCLTADSYKPFSRTAKDLARIEQRNRKHV